MKRGLREAIDWLKEQGAENVHAETGRQRHYRIRYVYQGQQCSQSLSRSPSASCWFKAFQREFRRVTTMPAGSHQINCRCG